MATLRLRTLGFAPESDGGLPPPVLVIELDHIAPTVKSEGGGIGLGLASPFLAKLYVRNAADVLAEAVEVGCVPLCADTQ